MVLSCLRFFLRLSFLSLRKSRLRSSLTAPSVTSLTPLNFSFCCQSADSRLGSDGPEWCPNTWEIGERPRAARQKPSSSAFILGGAVLTFRSSPVPGSHLLGRHLQPVQIGTQGPGFLWHPFQKLQFGCDVEFLWPVCCFGSGEWILYWD